MSIKKEESVQRLILGRRADVLNSGEIVEECGNLLLTHGRGMPTLMKQHKSSNPIAIGFFSPLAVVASLQPGANALQ
jgi:hypothetical protein